MNEIALPNPSGDLLIISRMMEQVAVTVQKTQDFAQEALHEVKCVRAESESFKESVQDVLERQNRIDSACVRMVREAVRIRVKGIVNKLYKNEPKEEQEHWKRRYFSWCYRCIHIACNVSNILDIPVKLFEIAITTARMWEPDHSLFMESDYE